MEAAPTTDGLFDAGLRRERAKQRLYVICQTVGWGLFLVVQLAFARVFWSQRPTSAAEPITDGCVMVTIILQGRLMALWSLVGFGFTQGVLQLPVRPDLGIWVSIVLSVINGAVMFSGWWCVYVLDHRATSGSTRSSPGTAGRCWCSPKATRRSSSVGGRRRSFALG